MPRSTISTFDPSNIGPDTPLRLEIAARLAFPDGSMGASGLRRERDRGHLVVEKIAGKEFTTLRNIEEMRKQCRAKLRVPDCGLNPKSEAKTESSSIAPHGSFATARVKSARAALEMTAKRLNERLPNTSPQSTGPTEPALVIPIKSSSSTC